MITVLTHIWTILPLYWWVVSFFGLLGASAVCSRAFESEASRSKRILRQKERELQSVTEKISSYAQEVHRRFPTGDVVISERDLAEQLRKPIDVVVMALNMLLSKQQVQRVALHGYWKLNA
jgi:hypothetical protein